MAAYRPHTVSSASDSATSRRALLTSAAAGIAALAATAIGGVAPRRGGANPGDPLIAGQLVTAGSATTALLNSSNVNHTLVVTNNGRSTAIRGTAIQGVGGRFQSGGKNKFALIATSSAGQIGDGGALLVSGGDNQGAVIRSNVRALKVEASSGGYGVVATSSGFAVHATSTGGTGVKGISTDGNGVDGSSSSDAGVMGSSVAWAGVHGSSVSGPGVYGTSVNSHAIQAGGSAMVEAFVEMIEMAAPDAPLTNRGRIFMRDSGGKTQLCVRFPTGAIQVISTEP